MALTGTEIIDAVATRLGLASASATTEPNRTQILEAINTSARIVIRRNALQCPELWKKTAAAGTPTDMLFPLAVLTSAGKPARYIMSREEYLLAVEAGKATADTPLWTFLTEETPGGTVKIAISPADNNRVFEYVVVPANYTDAASHPAAGVPDRFEYDVIKETVFWLKLGDQQDYAGQVLVQLAQRKED